MGEAMAVVVVKRGYGIIECFIMMLYYHEREICVDSRYKAR
jgi:hypothetical protein